MSKHYTYGVVHGPTEAAHEKGAIKRRPKGARRASFTDSEAVATVVENYVNGNLSDVQNLFENLKPLEAAALAAGVMQHLLYYSDRWPYEGEAGRFARWLGRIAE